MKNSVIIGSPIFQYLTLSFLSTYLLYGGVISKFQPASGQVLIQWPS